MAEKITELAKRLRPFLLNVGQSVVTQILNAAEGPGIDIPAGTNVIGIGGDSILLFLASLDPAQEFAVTDAGLDAASAAASSGDVIYIPKGSSITFGTPNWTRFVYVVFPVNWNEK